MLKLVDYDIDRSIPISKMKDGDVAIIVDWAIPGMCGKVVQKYKGSLVALGESSGNGWSNPFPDLSEKNRVRVLEIGETLTVV